MTCLMILLIQMAAGVSARRQQIHLKNIQNSHAHHATLYLGHTLKPYSFLVNFDQDQVMLSDYKCVQTCIERTYSDCKKINDALSFKKDIEQVIWVDMTVSQDNVNILGLSLENSKLVEALSKEGLIQFKTIELDFPNSKIIFGSEPYLSTALLLQDFKFVLELRVSSHGKITFQKPEVVIDPDLPFTQLGQVVCINLSSESVITLQLAEELSISLDFKKNCRQEKLSRNSAQQNQLRLGMDILNKTAVLLDYQRMTISFKGGN